MRKKRFCVLVSIKLLKINRYTFVFFNLWVLVQFAWREQHKISNREEHGLTDSNLV